MSDKIELIRLCGVLQSNFLFISQSELRTQPCHVRIGLISPLSLLLWVHGVKKIYRKSWPETLFQMLNLTFDPFFNVKYGYLTSKALYLP